MWIYTFPVRPLTGPAEILAACDNHPFARLGVGTVARPVGVTDSSGTLFVGASHEEQTTGYFLGEPDSGLFRHARSAGMLDGLGWLHLPRGLPLPAGFVMRDHWDLMWAEQLPPHQPAQDSVVPLPDAAGVPDEINALLDLAMPDSAVRPGHPASPQWYGIRDQGILVACAADRSSHHPTPTPVGMVGGVAVHPDFRGRGYGAAVSAAITAALLRRFDMVMLGVWPDNDSAIRIYRRLGYAGDYAVTSVRPAR